MLENFKNECKNDAYNNRLGKVIYDDIKEITHNDNLASLELTEDCYVNGNIIGTTNTKSIKINTIGKPNIFNGELENGSIDKNGENGVSPELDTTTYIELKEKLNSINDVADEHDVISGKGIKRIGKIDSYNGESITTNYMSTTGKLTTGATVYYVLETPQEFTTEPVNIQLRKGYNRIEIKDKNGLLNKIKLNYLADTEKTVEGTNSIIIDDAEPVNARSLIVYGNSYQEIRNLRNLFNYRDTNEVEEGYTINSNDWITIRKFYSILEDYNFSTHDLNIKQDTDYLIVLEVKSVSGTGRIYPVSTNIIGAQFDTEVYYDFSELKEGDVKVNLIHSNKDYKPGDLDHQYGLRTHTDFNEEQDGELIFRLSVLEDTSITPEQFIYEPYGAMPSPEFPSEIKCVEGISNSFNTKIITEKELKGGTYEIINDNNYIIDLTNSTAPGWSWLTFKAENLKKNTDYIFKFDLQKENEDKADIWTIIQTLPNSENGHIAQSYDADNNGLNFNSGNYETLYIKTSVNANATNNIYYFNNIKLCENNLEDIPFGKFLKLVDTGKNLFSGWNKGIGLSATNGREISSQTNASSDFIKINFKENLNYFISGLSENLYDKICAYNNSKEFLGRTTAGPYDKRKVSNDIFNQNVIEREDNEIAYIRVDIYENPNVQGTIDEVDNLLTQLEPGDQTTDYEPAIPNKVRNTEKFAIGKSTYTIDLTGATDTYLFFYDENDNLISKSGYHKLPYTFNNTDAKYVRFMFKDANNDNLDVNDITDIQINDKFSLYGKDVDANVGVKYDDDSEEYIELGKYTIDKPNDEETVNLGEYKGYDYLDKLNDNYVCSFESFANITVKDIYSDLCEQVGLAPETLDFENNDIPVTGNIFEEGYTRKEVLSDIAELASSFACINKENNQCCLKALGKEPVEVITKEDYSLLTKNQQYGPLNCLVIKDSQFEGENVSIQDDDSINKNGETQYAIIDNIFLYTPELREQALNKIWASIKGLTYYDCKIESYHGLPYLNAGDKITVEDDNGNYFDTYVLKHTFTYDGTYKSVIESPALTKQETNIKSDVSLKDRLRKTYANVKKAENKIELLTTEVNNNSEKTAGIEITLDGVKQEVDNLSDQSETIVKLQTDVEGIKAQIGSITDVTVNANGIGNITLNNVLTSELLYLQVYPTSEDLSYLNLSPKTYLSNNTKITSRDLLFINTKTNETTKYTLPCNLYYISDDVKDELIIDYDNKQLMVTHRVGINAETGEKYALSKPTTKLYDYKSINLNEGNYTIKMQSFNTAYINARALANSIYTAQYTTRVEVDNAIKLSEEGIRQEVNGKVTNIDGSVKELRGSLELKLNTKDLCTELNGSADKITFKGNRFSWQSTYSSMSETGTLKATNVDLTGKITASSGTIGGFTITSNSIYKGSNALGTSGSGNIYLGTNGLSISNTFKVTNTGVLTASGATISGTITTSNITATGGTIGGFKLTSSSIYRGSSSFGTSGSGNIYIGTSGISISNAFKVSNNGTLTATGATISGNITTSNISATGGKIGGASLNNLGIYFNNGSTGWGLWGTTAHANIVFHAGANSTNIGGAPFRVLHDGTVYASKINIPNGTIAGMTVSNGKFASNRMNLDNTHGSLELYNDGGGKVLFNSGARIAVPAGIMISSKCSGDRSAPSNGDINIIAGMSRSVYLASFSSDRPNSSDYEHQCICITENSVQANWQNIATSSSKATKTNINLLKNEEKEEIYNIVKNLDFYKYDYKEKYSGRKNNYGFLIEDIENTVLETLLHVYKSKNDKNYKNYNCEDLTRIILIIVQELQNKIEKLESKN